MSGLKALGKAIDDGCDSVIDKAQRLKNLRDPQRARELGAAASRELGEVAKTIEIINREGDAAWDELDKMKAKKA